MIPTDLSPLWNHLWQSTLCAAAVWLLTLAVRKNRAAVRYWLWFAASVKFLVPFSLLASAASQLEWRTTPLNAPPAIAFAVEQVSQPFALPVSAPAPAQSNPIPAILLVLWLTGVVIGIGFWLRWWRSIEHRPARGTAALTEPADLSDVRSRPPGTRSLRHTQARPPTARWNRRPPHPEATGSRDCPRALPHPPPRQSHRRHPHGGGNRLLVSSAGLVDPHPPR